MRALGAIITGLAFCTLAGCAAPRPGLIYQEGKMSITRMDFHGWHDCYRMSNGTVEVVLVPQVARIMQYGYCGEDGLLFVNPALTPEATGGAEPAQYPNYGGHKLWVAPQKAWGWPPQPELDRGPCSVEVLPDGALRMKGMPSPAAGVRLDRLLRLDPEGTRLTIEQTMTCVADTPVTWAVWDVTQVASEGTVVIPLGPDSHARFEPGPAPTADWRRLAEAYLVGSPHGAQKVFVTGGPGWLACRCGDRLLLKSFDVRRAQPPEPETPREVWVGTAGFIELEFVGPQVTLEPGQATSLTQEWRCFPLGPDAATDEGLLREVRKAAEATGL